MTFRPALLRPALLLPLSIAALCLAACGAEDSGSKNPGGAAGSAGASGSGGAAGSAGAAEAGFRATPQTFTAHVGQGPPICYDFDADAAVACDAVGDWDLMFEADEPNRSFSIWTNGGVHGAGLGASYGPVSPEDAAALRSDRDVNGWFADYYGGIFADVPWYAYDVRGTHDVSANGRVYVIDTGTDLYRVQLTSYYSPGGASGKVGLRFGKHSETAYAEVVLDATAGGFGALPGDPANHAAYFDLDAGAVVELSDAQAKENTTWDLAVKRYTVTLNGGASGPGTVRGAVADAREELYDAKGRPILARFEATTDAVMKASFEAAASVNPLDLSFKLDKTHPYMINSSKADSWFGVKPPPPIPPEFYARPENWWAVRAPDGKSFAKLHVTEVESPDYSFTVELFVQPRED